MDNVSCTMSKAYFSVESIWSVSQPEYSAWFSFCFLVCLSALIFFMSTIVGNICYSGSVGLPHSAGRAHLVWGTIIYSYDDGKGRARCGLVGPFAKVTQYNKLFNTFIMSLSFSFLMYASSLSPTLSFRTGRC